MLFGTSYVHRPPLSANIFAIWLTDPSSIFVPVCCAHDRPSVKNANERSPEYARVKKNVSALITVHSCPFAYRHACGCVGN